MKSDSIKKNFFFQFIYQIVILFIPLITAPYLTRTLGDNSLGIYSYSNSIVNYFIIFAMLGIMKYGQRIIATKKSEETSLRKTFWSLYILHFIVSIFSVAIYVLILKIYNFNPSNIYWIQIIYVMSATFDVTWLFYGLENFKSVVIKNFIFKIIECISIFGLVKNPNDLWIYTLIMSISIFGGQLVVFVQAMRIIKPIKISVKDIWVHLGPMVFFSITVIAISLYSIFDKILLGILSTMESVAYYEYSNKIINIPKSLIAVIGTVIFPRACNCFYNKEYDALKKYFKISLYVVYFIGIGTIFGLLGISDLFAVLYYGNDFAVCGSIIKVLSPMVLILGLGDIIRNQYLIPMKKDMQYTLCIIGNAIVNLILSIMLIPKIGIYGAILGTFAAELFGLITQMFICRKEVDIKIIFNTSIPFVIAGLFMYVIIEILKRILSGSYFALFIYIIIGALIYIIIILMYFLFISRDKLSYWKYLKDIINKYIKKKIA